MKYPQPPHDLAALDLPLVDLDRSWYRLHASGFDPIYFNREPTYRFNAPAKEFGVLYVADSIACAFVETFAHDPSTRIVSRAQLAARGLAQLTATGPLKLVDLSGPGLRRLGGDGSVTSGLSYRTSQRWSLALQRHPSQPDGVLYRARHDQNLLAVALFDRAAARIHANSLGTLADSKHAHILGAILDQYGFGLC